MEIVPEDSVARVEEYDTGDIVNIAQPRCRPSGTEESGLSNSPSFKGRPYTSSRTLYTNVKDGEVPIAASSAEPS